MKPSLLKRLSKIERHEDLFSVVPMSEIAEAQTAYLDLKKSLGISLKDIQMFHRKSGKRGLFLCEEFRIFLIGYLSHRLRGVDEFIGDAI